jgi:hypothetical protein
MNINETNRIKLLMGYDVKKTLTENQISLPMIEEGYVFDFVIPKNYILHGVNTLGK